MNHTGMLLAILVCSLVLIDKHEAITSYQDSEIRVSKKISEDQWDNQAKNNGHSRFDTSQSYLLIEESDETDTGEPEAHLSDGFRFQPTRGVGEQSRLNFARNGDSNIIGDIDEGRNLLEQKIAEQFGLVLPTPVEDNKSADSVPDISKIVPAI